MIPLNSAIKLAATTYENGDPIRPDYLECLYNYVKNLVPDGGTILEVGTKLGDSTIAMGAACVGRGIKIYTVDPVFRTGFWHCADAHKLDGHWYHSSYEVWQERIRKCGLEGIIETLAMTSEEALVGWNRPLDLAVIDGCHTYDAVTIDCRWLEHVKIGGYAAFDDWFDEIERAVRNYINGKSWQILHENTKPQDGYMVTTLLRKNGRVN